MLGLDLNQENEKNQIMNSQLNGITDNQPKDLFNASTFEK